jgi:hypothetical protein
VAGSVWPDWGGEPLSWELPLPVIPDDAEEPDDEEEPEDDDDPDDEEPDEPDDDDPEPDWPDPCPLNGSWYWLSPAPWARAVPGMARTSATRRTAQRDIGATL